MNKEHVTGKAEEIKGVVKENLGFITSDPDTEADGVNDQIKGKAKQAHAAAKDAQEKLHKTHTP
jgi:uncharacterized protein YjbJ (UPF0337 family)